MVGQGQNAGAGEERQRADAPTMLFAAGAGGSIRRILDEEEAPHAVIVPTGERPCAWHQEIVAKVSKGETRTDSHDTQIGELNTRLQVVEGRVTRLNAIDEDRRDEKHGVKADFGKLWDENHTREKEIGEVRREVTVINARVVALAAGVAIMATVLINLAFRFLSK
jgi:hypothetical protein